MCLLLSLLCGPLTVYFKALNICKLRFTVPLGKQGETATYSRLLGGKSR